jgi:hypothetical protein
MSMSHDQKPQRVRAIDSGVVKSANGAGKSAETHSAAGDDAGDNGAQPKAGGGLSFVSILLFLLGCSAGGAMISALPHYISMY